MTAAGDTILVRAGRYTLPNNAVNHWSADNVVFLDKPLIGACCGGRSVIGVATSVGSPVGRGIRKF